ncbi:MAG: hypothetical protein IKD79_01995 [Oscillospiraceae bacterium]|jgi:hypothetical protein|nr:hypothetical protein [Oscillospiraceae bacterium]
MRKRISAEFDSVDEAERAISRLRSALPYLDAAIDAERSSAVSGAAPFAAAVYYPWSAGTQGSDLSMPPRELGSRVIYTSDLLGLPVYPALQASVTLSLDAADIPRARALLCNAGGRRLKELS